MLKSTKNELLHVVQARADATLFEHHDTTKELSDPTRKVHGTFSEFTIQLRGSPLAFLVRHAFDDWSRFNYSYVRFAAGFPLTDPLPDGGFAADLNTIAQALGWWLMGDVREYLEETAMPDEWQKLEEERALFGSTRIQPGDLDRFDEQEKTQARAAILELERQIHREFEPTAEQAEVIAAQLRYLSAALDRLNRFDWRSVLLSTVIGITTTLSMDTETGRRLFEIARQIFAAAVKYLPG